MPWKPEVTTETAKSTPNAGWCRLPAVLLLLAPILSLHKSLVMAPALSAMAAWFLWCLIAGGGARPSFQAALGAHRRVLVPLALLWLWCMGASLWSFRPLSCLVSGLMLGGTIAGGWIAAVALARIDERGRRLLIQSLAAGLAVAGAAMVVCGVIERAHLADIGHVLWDMDAATTIVALLVWPVFAWLDHFGRRAAGLVLVLLCLAGVLLSHDLAAKVAFILAILVLGPARLLPKATFPLMAAMAVGLCLAAPWAALSLPAPQVSAGWSWLPSSAHHRLTIWSFAAHHIADKPLVGWGFDSARAIPGGKTRVPVVRMTGCKAEDPLIEVPGFDHPVPGDCVTWEESLPLHPHDAWLQVWLELGAVGALLVAWGMAAVIWSGARMARPATAAATLAVGLVVCSVSFGAWQSWWLSTLWIAAALLLTPADAGSAAGHHLGKPRTLV
jgi:O-antigen ligase